MKLNEEQTLAATHPQGEAALLLAGAGSGKTTALTERIAWLIEQGVPPRRILALTFTNKAAREMERRVLLRTRISKEQAPRLTTIHSLALSFIRRNPGGFGLADKVSPLADYDQTELLKKIMDRMKEKAPEANVWKVREKIEFHRARGVSFAVEYSPEVHERATTEHRGYHALEPEELEVWKQFETDKRQMSVVDFADMIAFVNRRFQSDPEWAVKVHKLFAHVLMDEAQDTSKPAWDFVNNLIGPDNRNLYVVGDVSQCQPPGTMVRVVAKYKAGREATTFKTVPIENLRDGAGVVAWTKADQRTYNVPRSVRVAQQPYSGPLLTIATAAGLTTRVTPNHWLWVRLSEHSAGKYMVYLMYREDFGYRIGVTRYRKGVKAKQGFGLSARLNREQAHKAWILRTFESRQEAEAWEEIYSFKYGIPESVFRPEYACRNKTTEIVRLVFSHADPEGALKCLADHGLSPDSPFATRSDDEEANKRNCHYRGYMRLSASHVACMAGAVDIPLFGVNQSTLITGVFREQYDGPVYSLDVDKEHTYVADGLVVGNSIMSFNGSCPKLVLDYAGSWRGSPPALYRLVRNHRSVPEVVKLANAIQEKMTSTLPLSMQSFRGMQGETGATKLIQRQDSYALSARIAQEIVNSGKDYREFAILVRASSQVREIEGELIRLRIPYIVRGGRGLLETEEARDILAYIRLAANPKDFSALSRSASAPKRGIGDVALAAVRSRAQAEFSGDLVKAAMQTGGKVTSFADVISRVQNVLCDPVKVFDQVLAFSGYKDYLRKRYAREPDRIEAKIENLNRLRIMIEGLSGDSDMSAEDLIFQLTMDRSEERHDERGMVTISTIHSAKGLEYPTVFIFNVVEGILPHQFASSEEEVEEERRLWYVAVTRARDTCFITLADTRRIGRNLAEASPSRFLTELDII